MKNEKIGYELYHNKEEGIIAVRVIGAISSFVTLTNEIAYYNDNYYVCLDKQKLFEKAEETRNKWVTEAEEYYNKMLNVRIKKTRK